MAALNAIQRAALDGNPWFAALPRAARDAVIAAAALRRIADGVLLFARGDVPDGWYGLVKGTIKIGSLSADGKEAVLTFLEPGTWFGEISLFDGLPRTHDGRAYGETEVLVVPVVEFHRLLGGHPALATFLIQLHCRHLRLLFAAIEDLHMLALPARLAKRLLGLSRSYGNPGPAGIQIALHLPQEELAQLLGASRQRVNQELKSWERNGWIAMSYGRVTIRDAVALGRIADDVTPD